MTKRYMAFTSPFNVDHSEQLDASASRGGESLAASSLLPSEFAESDAGWSNPLFEEGLEEVFHNPAFDEDIRRQRELIVALQANIRRRQ